MLNLIDCSELNWDRGLVTEVPVSFAGVDSLDETRFCFSLVRPSHFETCCCSAPPLTSPIHLHPPLPALHPPGFSAHQHGRKGMREVDTLSDLIDYSELNWDRGLVTVAPVSFVGVDSLDETRFCYLLGSPLHFETCCCSAPPPISN